MSLRSAFKGSLISELCHEYILFFLPDQLENARLHIVSTLGVWTKSGAL
jgi:hypothetical protein